MNRNTKSPNPTELSERQLTQLITFSKFANISKFKVVLCYLAKLLHHSHMSKFSFHLRNQTCDKTWIYFVYIWVFLCWSLAWTFKFDFPLKELSNLTFLSKISAHLTANWKQLALSAHPQMKNKIMKNALTRIFTTVKIELKINDDILNKPLLLENRNMQKAYLAVELSESIQRALKRQIKL